MQEKGQVDRAAGDQGGRVRRVRRSDGPVRVAGIVGEPVQDAEVREVTGGDQGTE